MPVPHLNIRIVQRSKGNSAVAGAAYQAGEKLFSEYDQKHKDHRRKQHEVVYTEIMLPILIGAGMALTAAWSGAPALYPGVITRQEKVNRALQAVSGRAFRGSSLMDSGAQEAITIWLPEMQFSLTGIWMGQQTM